VSRGFTGTERFDPGRHNSSTFGCGHEVLDRWLARFAGQSERRDAARTFVATDVTDATARVLAYYTLVAGLIEHEGATVEVREGMSRHYPIPTALLARLAVDRRDQGRGFGAGLLNDALGRVSLAAEQVAIRAVVVHAIDDNAAGFYRHHGFRPLTATPRTLMVSLAELRAAGYP
jgi:GNAT superfamily N-acetyltransferase